MTGSALIGHPPNNEDDSWIVKGFFRAKGLPDAAWNKTSVIPIRAPPGAPHDSRKTGLIVSMAFLITLVTLITGTRLSLRLFRKDLRWGLDDWTIIIGYLGVISFFGITIAAAEHGGAGRHLYDLTYAEFNTYMSLMWVGQTLFYPVVATIKISIVLFNRRLTGLTSRKWMIVHNTFLCLLVCYIIITIFINIFICVPHPKDVQMLSIGKMKTPPRWMKAKPIVPAFSIIHILFDFALLSVPLIVLYRLKMDLTKKLRLGFLFSIGAVSTIGAVMRAVIQNHKKPDITYEYPDYIRWTIIDIFFAITVASLPTLNNLIPSHWGQSRKSGSDLSTTKVNTGTGRLDSKTTIGDPRIHDLDSKDSQALTDEESGNRKLSGSTGVGSQPDWNEYHPEAKGPV